jgi:hypothetical protein
MISPDGRTVMLLDAGILYSVDANTGAGRAIRDYKTVKLGLGVVRQGQEVTVQGYSVSERYSWQGEKLGDLPGENAIFSPDGSLVAWEEKLAGFVSAVVVADAASLQPRFRAVGASLCYDDLGTLGGRWLGDSSGLVLLSGGGYHIVDREGNLRDVPVPDGVEIEREIVPAPDRADLFVIDRRLVVDASGKRLSEVTLWDGSGIMPGHTDSWGIDSAELRFTLPYFGLVGGCRRWSPAPRVDRALFVDEMVLVVGLPAGDC